jgi:hypothetical protein
VTLHESNAGHLFITAGGAQLAYDVTEAAEPEGFEFDAVALLNSDTGDWTVPTQPTEEITGIPVVAEYDGTTGEVRLLADRVGGKSAGHAARTYSGALHYGEEPATEPEEVVYYLGHVTKKGTVAILTTVRYTQVSGEQVKAKRRQITW